MQMLLLLQGRVGWNLFLLEETFEERNMLKIHTEIEQKPVPNFHKLILVPLENISDHSSPSLSLCRHIMVLESPFSNLIKCYYITEQR